MSGAVSLLANVSITELLLFPVLGLIALACVLRTGHLKPRSLDDAPLRITGLGMNNLVVALGIFLLAALLVGKLLPQVYAALKIPDDKGDPWHAVVQALAGQGLLFLPIAVYVMIKMMGSPRGPYFAGLQPREPRKEIRRAGLALLAVLPMVMGTGTLVSGIGQFFGHPPPDFGHDLLRVMCDSYSDLARIILIAVAVVLAPLLEEVIFRGLVQSVMVESLGPQRRWTAIVLAAAVFTAIHGSVAWQSMPALMVLAVTLGWLFERTGSLLPCILVHAGFNAFNTGIALVSCAAEKS